MVLLLLVGLLFAVMSFNTFVLPLVATYTWFQVLTASAPLMGLLGLGIGLLTGHIIIYIGIPMDSIGGGGSSGSLDE